MLVFVSAACIKLSNVTCHFKERFNRILMQINQSIQISLLKFRCNLAQHVFWLKNAKWLKISLKSWSHLSLIVNQKNERIEVSPTLVLYIFHQYHTVSSRYLTPGEGAKRSFPMGRKLRFIPPMMYYLETSACELTFWGGKFYIYPKKMGFVLLI